MEKDGTRILVNVVDVKFRTAGKIYRYDAVALPIHEGDRILVQSDHTTKLGTAIGPSHPVEMTPEEAETTPRILRKAGPRDLAREEANLRRCREAHNLCMERVRDRGLKMKIINTECLFDGSKITIFFFAEDRVDFRELVRDLAQSLHTRIEMKQVGPRDETKIVGGVGPCGLQLCCTAWLRDFSAVSVKMAKEQGISLNPTKLAGMCRRLKCCLRYEYELYHHTERKPGGRSTATGNGDQGKSPVESPEPTTAGNAPSPDPSPETNDRHRKES